MKPEFYCYVNFNNYKSQLAMKHRFILVFEIGKNNSQFLGQIIGDCELHAHFYGVVFKIDLNLNFLGKFLFLKTFIERLLLSHKKVGIWGVPVCVPRTILNPYFFLRFSLVQIHEDPVSYMNFNEPATFLPECDSCLDQRTCKGVGSKNIELFKPKIKRKRSFRVSQLHDHFGTAFPFLSVKHKAFMEHCYQSDEEITERSICYTTNIDFGSTHSYTERFVYACTFISPCGFTNEFDFLRNNCINSPYVDLLQSKAGIDQTVQIAYSIAQRDNVIRETFYMYTPKHYGELLLRDFNIGFSLPQSRDMRFIGIGLDVIEGKTTSYKLYFRSLKSFVRAYLEPFGINASQLKYKVHDVVLRLNEDQELQSYKIELHIQKTDLELFKDLIKNYNYFFENFEKLGIFILAIEFEQNRISKLNFYHNLKAIKESNN